ncbi:MAG: hypothetical protein IJ538_03430 [Clostridia bacterium]|nr:hypothetical protein [Clostridia bacterium]
METRELNELIDAFVKYREMLLPIQNDMHEFLVTYDALKQDVDSLNKTFSGDAQKKLNDIYVMLSSQAEKSEQLTRKVDQFLTSTNKYTEQVDSLIKTFSTVSEKLGAIDSIEKRAEEQIGKLDEILEDKRKNYNIKELERSLDQYNSNLQAVSEYINSQVIETLMENSKTIQSVKSGNENIAKSLADERKNIDELVKNYQISNELLKKIVEKNDVNEEYIFDVLDRWAEERHVKYKK